MTRTFYHRVTVGAVCGIVLLLALSLYAFWTKEVILGLALAVGLVMVAERALHSQYTLGDGRLTIHRGRLAKDKAIPVGEITSCRPMTSAFGLSHYLLITYGGGKKLEALQPANEKAFAEALAKMKSEKAKEEKAKGEKEAEKDNNEN